MNKSYLESISKMWIRVQSPPHNAGYRIKFFYIKVLKRRGLAKKSCIRA